MSPSPFSFFFFKTTCQPAAESPAPVSLCQFKAWYSTEKTLIQILPLRTGSCAQLCDLLLQCICSGNLRVELNPPCNPLLTSSPIIQSFFFSILCCWVIFCKMVLWLIVWNIHFWDCEDRVNTVVFAPNGLVCKTRRCD